MKKNLLTLLAAAAVSVGFSQSIPNGSFESWTGTNYGVPNNFNFQVSNVESLRRIGMTVVTQTNDAYNGSFAIRMDTKANSVDTAFGFFLNGMPCGPGNPNPGGTPYVSMPTSFTGHYKCNVPAGDTALVFVVFKKNSIATGFFLKKFFGVQSSYAAFSLPISLSAAPDTVIVGGVSSNVIAGGNGIPGSMLQLDSLNFKGAPNPILWNGSFENWTTSTYYTPNNWQAAGDSVMRSTSSYTGSYAVSLMVRSDGGGCGGGGGNNVNGDQITTGWQTKNSGPKGGYPYTLQNDSLVGYYKFAPMGGDTASINISTSKLNSNIGGGYIEFKTSTGGVYKRFTTPVNSSMSPDTIRVDINAGRWPYAAAMVGSKLWVDAIQLNSQPLSVPVEFMGPRYFNIHPNPSNGIFSLVYDSDYNEPVTLKIYSETGQLIDSQSLTIGAKNRIDLSSYGKGLYLLKTEQNGYMSTKRILVQ